MLQLKSQQGLPVIGICNIDTGMDTDTNIDMDMDIGIDLDVDIDVDTDKDIQRDTHTHIYIYIETLQAYIPYIYVYTHTHTDRIHHNGKKEPSGAVVKLLYIIEMMKLLCSAGPGAESWISQC